MATRWTKDSFNEYLESIGSDVRMLGDYTAMKVKTLFVNLTTNEEWMVTPDAVKHGVRRPNNYFTTETFSKKVSELNPDIEFRDEYTHAKLYKFYCRKCNREFLKTSREFISNPVCPIETKVYRVITHEDYLYDLAEKGLTNVEVLEEYKGVYKEILHRCTRCGNEFKITPNRILISKYGCPNCAENNRYLNRAYTQEKFDELLGDLPKQKEYELLSKYTGCDDKMECHCNICGELFYKRSYELLGGESCPKCGERRGHINKRISNEEFVERLKASNPSITPLESYVTTHTKIKCRCDICKFEWMVSPLSVYKNGCPVCRVSRGEKRVKEFLDSVGEPYIQQYRYDDLPRLSFDFYLPNRNTLIEYQGEQHERPVDIFGGEKQFEIQKYNDNKKREYAKDNGIKLLEIWYYDFDNVEEILRNELEKEVKNGDNNCRLVSA